MGQNKAVDPELPLKGRRVVITRPRSQAQAFARQIENLGGEVVAAPTIEIVPPASYESLDRAIERIASYDWIIFTSVNGVKFLIGRMRDLGVSIALLGEKRIGAIGPQTARELAHHQISVGVVPREYRAEAIVDALAPREIRGQRILLPRAAKARDVLPAALRKGGAEVDVVEAYRAVPVPVSGELVAELRAGRVDAVTFTSSSTVEGFVAVFLPGQLSAWTARVCIACIGPITQAAAERAGLRVDVVAREYTAAGLAQALGEYFRRQAGR
ncbi:MAG TPA: uroporphyrinogen-III synthase [Candidatus Acidoferrales bacterium]|nr:uroporphyrinogen-III synthase [Candidatus Acidoferrales bacterium]